MLENEPIKQFDDLLEGIRNDLQPEETLEEVLVEKLAALMRRYRRMLVAERAEVRIEQRDSSSKAERERLYREETLALETAEEFSNQGLLGDLRNPFGVESSLELLKTLKKYIGIRDFKPDEGLQLIMRVFGRVNCNCSDHMIMYTRRGLALHQPDVTDASERRCEIPKAPKLVHAGTR